MLNLLEAGAEMVAATCLLAAGVDLTAWLGDYRVPAGAPAKRGGCLLDVSWQNLETSCNVLQHLANILQFFGVRVLGCIEADVCEYSSN